MHDSSTYRIALVYRSVRWKRKYHKTVFKDDINGLQNKRPNSLIVRKLQVILKRIERGPFCIGTLYSMCMYHFIILYTLLNLLEDSNNWSVFTKLEANFNKNTFKVPYLIRKFNFRLSQSKKAFSPSIRKRWRANWKSRTNLDRNFEKQTKFEEEN